MLNQGLIAVAFAASALAGVGAWRMRARDAHPTDAILAAIVIGFGVLFGAAHLLALTGDTLGMGLFSPAWMAISTTCLAAVVTLGLWRRSDASATGRAPAAEPAGSFGLLDQLAFAASVAVFVGLVAVVALLGPLGYEADAYHLPLAVFFMQSRSLQLWDTLYMNVYPADASVLVALLLELGGERLAALVGMIFLPVCLLALFRLCVIAGGDRRTALLFALGFAFVPLISFGAIEVASDIQALAFALVAVIFVLRRPVAIGPWWLLAGVAGGLAFSTKSLYLVTLAATAIAGTIVPLLWRDGALSPVRVLSRSVFPMLGFGAVAAGIGSYWMIRNFVAFGNPLFPVHVPILSTLLGWPGSTEFAAFQNIATQYEWVRSSGEWAVYPWVEHHFNNQNFKASAGLGPFFALAAPAALICGVAKSASTLTRGARSSADSVIFGLVVVMILSLAAWWALGDRQPRYALGAVAMLLPVGAMFAAGLQGGQRWLFLGAARAAIAFSAFAFLVSLSLQVGGDVKTMFSARADRREYPALLDRLPPGSVVVNLFDRTKNFVATGSGFTNRVIAFRPIDLARQQDANPEFARRALSAPFLRQFAPSEIYVYAWAEVLDLPDRCVGAERVAELTRNPFNGTPLPVGRYLYKLRLSC